MAWHDAPYSMTERMASPECDSVISDGCWESARSSWIYMEMEPRPEGCTRLFEDCDDGQQESGRIGVRTIFDTDALECMNSNVVREDNGVIKEEEEEEEEEDKDDENGDNDDDDDNLEDEVETEEEEDEEEEGDYAVIENDDEITPGSSLNLKLQNSNFILRRGNSTTSTTTDAPPLPGAIQDQKRLTRRSVSLDTYHSFNAYKSSIIKQSETVSFSPISNRPKELPGLRFQPLQRLPHRPSCLHHPHPHPPSSLSPHTQDADSDRHSIASACTVTTTSTTSCNSLYRIPAKMRKLSSASSSKSAKTPDSLSSPSQPLSFYSSSASVPKLLQEVMASLWSDNPDRDPYNTFNVSESELTSAIAHLEHQLSNSTRSSSGRDSKPRPSLFSSLSVPSGVPSTTASSSSSTSTPAPRSNTNPLQIPIVPSSLPPPPSCPLPEVPSPSSSGDNRCSGDSLETCKTSFVKHAGSGGTGTGGGKPQEFPFRVQFIMESYCNIFMMRKQDLRELKLLQKQENKQITDLQYKNHLALEGKEKKFESDISNLKKQFDQDLDVLLKQQKQIIEKAEQTQNNDMKNASKRIKGEQEKEMKHFRDNQKQEMKLFKQQLNLQPRDNSKEAAQKMRESKQIDLEKEERDFLEKQAERMDAHMTQLANTHRQKIAMLESQCLQQKQQMFRSREASLWEMEKTQLHERHQLAKTQLKDMFFVKRHQMLNRHQKEMDNLKRYNHMKEEEMSNRHTMEKRRLPKVMKSEAKTRAQMFKQSLRLSTIGTPDEDKAKIKQFEESEKKRMKSEQMRQEEKHRRQAKALMDKNEAAVKELENLQGEKRKMLMEQETQKIKELEDQFNLDMKEWKALLTPRKQALEDQFQSETEEQQSFYSDVMQSDMPNFRSSAASVRSKSSKDGTINSRHSTVI